MTIEDRLTAELTSRGMWPKDTTALMQQLKADAANETSPFYTMHHRWHDDVEAYPKAILGLCWLELQRRALSWIDDNCPKAFYRSVVAELPY